MWAAIVGLHTLYPEALSSLKDGWWHNATQLETLSALALWRKWIDDADGDPLEELAFQVQLANYGHALRQAGGSIKRAWQPGAPPVEWSWTTARHPDHPKTDPHWNFEAPQTRKSPTKMGLQPVGDTRLEIAPRPQLR